ncbi:ribonuclease P protein component [Halofilum ochraceum]|uniref:ribonuclease P protein component n=1 Tax=Halofilum ochraceum TaxID=1611323 RepID=UPI0008DADB32|nr:ribonuclease P protein component [Halofilum ochraceum]
MAGFPRHHRLLRPVEFRAVFERATRAGDSRVTVLARANALPYGRLGLAVGRRKIALATRRNTFKRVVRESFRAHPEYTAGLDFIVLPKPAAARADRAELRASIDRQWRILHQRLART